MKKVEAPWKPGQVDRLNGYQESGVFHPFTCGRCRDADESWPLEDQHLLVATEEGWTCPTCDYTQTWAWTFMIDGWQEAKREQDRLFGRGDRVDTVEDAEYDQSGGAK